VNYQRGLIGRLVLWTKYSVHEAWVTDGTNHTST